MTAGTSTATDRDSAPNRERVLAEGDAITITDGKAFFKEKEVTLLLNLIDEQDSDWKAEPMDVIEEPTDEDKWFDAIPSTPSSSGSPFDSRPLLFITVQLNGRKHLAMVDSGSSTSYMDVETARLFSIPVEKVSPSQAMVGSGETFTLDQRAEPEVSVRFRVGGAPGSKHCRSRTTFAVASQTSFPIILGMNWLEDNGVILNCEEKSLRIKGRTVKGVDPYDSNNVMSCTQLRNLLDREQEPELFLLSMSPDEEEVKVAEAHSHEAKEVMAKFKELFPDNLPYEVPKEAAALYAKYSHLFPEGPLPPELPPERVVDCTIPITPGAKPPFRPAYKLGPEELEALRKTLKELTAKGMIRPSLSPYGAPVLMVRQNGKFRFCVDYRALNQVSQKFNFALPSFDTIISKLHGNKVFSSIDLTKGYYQVRVAESDVHKTAFNTPLFGSHEWLVMPMGLKSAPAIFNRIMYDVLGDYIGKICFIYLDDIIVFSKSRDEHRRHLEMILQRLGEHKLYCARDKCRFFQSELKFLGFIIGNGKVMSDPAKIKAMVEWPQPKSVKEVKMFLGLTGFYRKFIARYAEIALPLIHLTMNEFRKNFRWTEEADAAFQALKTAMVKAPVLLIPDPNTEFIVATDASDFAVGGVIMQDVGAGPQPIAFASRKLQPNEVNYCVYDKELLAITYCLEEWSHLLSYKHFQMWTDHHSLTFLLSQSTLNRRQAKWLDILLTYDVTLKYIPGALNVVADALSRRPDHLTALHLNAVGVAYSEAGVQVADDLCERIVRGYEQDGYFNELWTALQGRPSKVTPNRLKRFTLCPNTRLILAIREGSGADRICIPRSDKKLVTQLLVEAHDNVYDAHSGINATQEKLMRLFFWPKMEADIKRFINSCIVCARTKSKNRRHGLINPIKNATHKWHTVSIDFVVDLPRTAEGFDAVMVVVDKLTKHAHFIPCRKSVTAEQAALLYLREVVKHHGIPQVLISDRDSKFTSAFWTELQKLLGTSLAMSTSHRPQTDGQTEIVNRAMLIALRCYVDYKMTNWERDLHLIEFAYNSRKHAATGFAPFYLAYGYLPVTPLMAAFAAVTTDARQLVEKDGLPPSVADTLENIRVSLLVAQDRLDASQDYMEELHNPHRTALQFSVGDKVMLATDYNLDEVDRLRPKAKLLPRYSGPYTVKAVKEFDTYTLDLPPAMARQHPDFHVSLLKPYHPNPTDFASRTPPTPTPVVEPATQALVYDVEELLDIRLTRSGIEYLVKWKGFDLADASWVPEYDVGKPLTDAFTAKRQTNAEPTSQLPRRSSRVKRGTRRRV